MLHGEGATVLVAILAWPLDRAQFEGLAHPGAFRLAGVAILAWPLDRAQPHAMPATRLCAPGLLRSSPGLSTGRSYRRCRLGRGRRCGPGGPRRRSGARRPACRAAGSLVHDAAVRGGAALDIRDVADLIPAARAARAALTVSGRWLSREALARDDGHGLSNARASVLLKILKAGEDMTPLAPRGADPYDARSDAAA